MSIKERIYHSKIKTKLVLLTMLILGITTLLLSSSIMVYDILNFKRMLSNEITLTANITGKRALSSLLFQQPEKAERDLQELEAKSSILKACFFDQDGNFFAEYSTDEALHICPKKAPPLGERFTFQTLTIHQPILSKISTTQQGSIYVLSDLREIYDNLKRYFIVVLIIMCCVIGIGYFLALQLQKIISGPLEDLSETTRIALRKRDYSVRAKHFYNDEIGVLTNTFNQFMKAVQDGRDNLEAKVHERTADLEREKLKAEQANRAKSEFLRNMSHEFRTPLHAMKAYSSFGVDDYDTASREQLGSYFDRIALVTKRLTSLVEALLSVAQLESGKQKFVMKEQDLRKSIDQVVVEQQALINEKDIELKLDIPDKPLMVFYDDGKIVQVLVNILGNAIKFTEPGKKITLAVSGAYIGGKNRKQAYRIEIIDQGIGIPDKELKKIFDKFIQSSRTNTGAGGTGLGLAIAKKMIRGHGGRIWAENNKNGVGAKFTIIIPKKQDKLEKEVKVI